MTTTTKIVSERVAERGAQEQATEPEEEADRRAAGDAAEDVDCERCLFPAHLHEGADLSDHGESSGARGRREPDDEAEAHEHEHGQGADRGLCRAPHERRGDEAEDAREREQRRRGGPA